MRRIKRNLMVIIILGIVVATFVSGFTAVVSFASVGKERSNDVLSKELEITSDYIDNTCVNVENVVLAMSDRFEEELPPLTAFSQPEGQTYLDNATALAESFVAYNDRLAAVYYRIAPELAGPKAGFFLSKTQESGEVAQREPTDLSLFAPDDDEHVAWYYAPKEAGEAVWISEYMNLNNGILTASYVKPIYAQDGTFVGIVGADIDLSEVYRRISDTRIFDAGFAALLSPTGKLRYSSRDMLLSDDDVQNIISQERSWGSYIQQQKRMTLLSQKLVYGDFLLISIADEELYAHENRVTFSIILTTLMVSLVIIAALTGLLNRVFDRFQIDPLTKARNRSAYADMISELEEQIRTREPKMSLIVFDVNVLKRVNDMGGHSAGDMLLVNAVNEIRKYFPREDIYRVGGDEFVILSKHGQRGSLAYAFRKFSQEMQARKQRYLEEPELVSLSSGMASFDAQKDRCYDDVFHRADAAMYADKADFYRINQLLERREQP